MRLITSNKATRPRCFKAVTVSVEGSRLCFNFWSRAEAGGCQRNVREEAPAHVLAEVRGFILSDAAAPLLDYLHERADLCERLRDAVAEAVEEFNRPSWYALNPN